MQEPYLHTENLAVGYRGRALISGIEISVARGQILTLIGPNGAGKSTILKSLARQLAPIGGAVYLEKQPAAALSEQALARKLSIVMTERITPERMSCEEVVSSGRYPYTGRLGILSAQDRAVVQNALRMVHAEALAGLDFMRVSDGQRQRILLARAFCQEPEVMVLDEPTSFLDIRHKLELITILKQMVAEKRMAVVLSLHELDLAQKISDLVVCVRDGRVDKIGPPEEVFTPGYIGALYGMTTGSYDAHFGGVELAAPKGPPRVFVIGGGGAGIPVYRKLQRRGIPFMAGILHAEDLDYPVAKALAAGVVAETSYEPVSEATLHRALAAMAQCGQVICCLRQFGSLNKANDLLRQTAADAGKLLRDGEF